MGERLLALRGATTCDEDTKAEIDAKTQALVQEMLERNDVEHDDIVSIIFTATDDLTAEFPATAARALGLGDVPLICARELGDRRRDAARDPGAHALYTTRSPRRAPPRVPRRRASRCETTCRSSGCAGSRSSVPASSEARSASR